MGKNSSDRMNIFNIINKIIFDNSVPYKIKSADTEALPPIKPEVLKKYLYNHTPIGGKLALSPIHLEMLLNASINIFPL